ncbi:hypothetical protein CK203_091820 [Vitis vinifera]|uniref:Retrotransposon gag domain-containing protein n=1 Tax=Vitis vinifera TaxID=29760 RepID=A0A438BM00_VITVI|nr:hypothetical protein CK203_091820 [Vitis vinifera]
MHPPHMSAPSCIVPPTEQLVIRPHIVSLLLTFHGMESENPYAHINEFEDVCNTFQDGGASIDLMRLKLFPFTLKDKVKIWLNSLRPRTKENEKFYECWEKYMEAINAFPHHGFDTWLLAGAYTFNEDIDMKAKVVAMTRRLEELELKKIREVQAVAETPVQVMPCPIYQSYEHLVEKCPTIPTIREMFGDQANVIGQFKPNNNASYGNTYNSNWRNHPNFSWKPRTPQYTQPGQASQQASNLEQAIVNLSKIISNTQSQGSQTLTQYKRRGNFLLNLTKTPKGIHEVEAHEGESSQVRDVKALITLRSGKKVELPTPKPHVEKEKEEEEETEKREEIKRKRKIAVKGKRTMIQQ